MELGNHAEFLGIMPSNEMLSRWFINDTMRAGGYRLKGHARRDFWSWVASWAVCLDVPSVIGGDDTGFVLPPLRVHRELVEVPLADAPAGYLFNPAGISATTIHQTKRLTNVARCQRAAELSKCDEPVIIWCDTNYEADALVDLIPDAIEIRGNDSEYQREDKLRSFSDGTSRCLITKPTIAGFGMNWQHCKRVIFVGLSYSFEQYYQAVRRCWRFGQRSAVDVYIIIGDCEAALESSIARKESDHELMKSGMSEAMREATMKELSGEVGLTRTVATSEIQLPQFLRRGNACPLT
jgi:hypothetical protein